MSNLKSSSRISEAARHPGPCGLCDGLTHHCHQYEVSNLGETHISSQHAHCLLLSPLTESSNNSRPSSPLLFDICLFLLVNDTIWKIFYYSLCLDVSIISTGISGHLYYFCFIFYYLIFPCSLKNKLKGGKRQLSKAGMCSFLFILKYCKKSVQMQWGWHILNSGFPRVLPVEHFPHLRHPVLLAREEA